MLRGKTILALLLVLMLGIGLASCGKDPSSAEPATEAEDATVKAEPLAVIVTETQEESETSAPKEDTTAEVTISIQATTSETETTTKTETTTAAAKMPSGKAEIIAYVNSAMKKVRQDKPGYTVQERAIIDDKQISSPSRLIDTLAPPIIRAAKGSWANWSDPSIMAPGADHSDVIPKVDLQSSWIKSATCTESGGSYQIRVNLIDERVPELPSDGNSTMHGKVAKVYTKGDVEDGASKVGVQLTRFDCLYSGSYIDLTVDKITGNVTKITAYISRQADIEAKLGLSVSVSIPLAMEKVYTF